MDQSSRKPRQVERALAPVIALGRAQADEAELVAALGEGASWAVAELYDRFGPLVRRVLVRAMGSADEVDDLIQETFVIVVRRARQIREPSALRSFIVGVSLRRARNELRKRALRRFIGLDSGESAAAAAAGDPNLTECVRHVYRALDRLDASSRLLFVLRHVEGLELKELALAVGCSLATIKRRLASVDSRFEAIASADPVLRDWLDKKEEP